MKYRRFIYKLALVVSIVLSVLAGQGAPSNFIYQGQIIKASGSPLSANPTIFTIQFVSPGKSTNGIKWSEITLPAVAGNSILWNGRTLVVCGNISFSTSLDGTTWINASDGAHTYTGFG